MSNWSSLCVTLRSIIVCLAISVILTFLLYMGAVGLGRLTERNDPAPEKPKRYMVFHVFTSPAGNTVVGNGEWVLNKPLDKAAFDYMTTKLRDPIPRRT